MLLNIAVSLLVWGVCIICAIRMFATSANIKVAPTEKPNLIQKILSTEKLQYKSYTATKKDYLKIAGYAVAFRICIYIIGFVAMRFYMEDDVIIDSGTFIGEWLRWDSNNYERIALLGYSGYTENVNGEALYSTLVFFPLYAWILKFFYQFVKEPTLAGMIASTVCYTVGCCYMFGALSLDYGKKIAKNTLIYLTIFPFSLFFGAVMPECTFFMTAAMCFYYTKKHNWCLATIAGIFCGLSRMQGFLMMIVAGVEWLETEQPIKKIMDKDWKALSKSVFTKAIFIPFMGLGFVIYLIINKIVTGDPFKFLYYQKLIWYQEATYFGKNVTDIWNRTFGPEHLTDESWIFAGFVPIVIFFICCFLMVYSVRKMHAKYFLLFVFYVIMNYMPSWLLSSGRYMSVCFPMFLATAIYTEKKENTHHLIITTSGVLFGVLLYAYLTKHQVL